MDICQKYKELTEKIFNEINGKLQDFRDRSEEEVRYFLVRNLENFMDNVDDIEVKKPILLEESRTDVLVGDIVIEIKRYGELANRNQRLNRFKNQVKRYMQERLSPFGILTDLNRIYFFELSEDGRVKPIKKSTSFNYPNFCYLLSLLFDKRKKFVSEFSLLTDFGNVTRNKLILNLLRKLFSLSQNYRDRKSQMLFLEWQKLFKLSETTHREYLDMRRRVLGDYFDVEINESNEYTCIFNMHTLISIIIKLLTYSFLANLKGRAINSESSIPELKNFYEKLERGEVFKEMEVINMCQSDFFSWYLNVQWDRDFFNLLLALKNRAVLYRYAKIENPMKLKDALQKLYENFIPREIRHSFGEYYTPPAISDFMVSEAKKILDDKISYRAIDPTCGSGTFLISLLKDKLYNKKNKNRSIRDIINEVVGIDLNPIAVLMSKFNYLLTIYPYFKKRKENPVNIEVPVYLGDASYMPTEEKVGNINCLTYDYYFAQELGIQFPKIVLPVEFVKNSNFVFVLTKVEEMIEQRKSKKEICEFIFDAIGPNLLNEKIKEHINNLINRIIEYHSQNLNTIWLFIFINYLRPFALNKFDLIIGNPPWVRWAVLPRAYKDKIKKSLREEGVFSRDKNYGGVDLNICALIAYRVVESLLNKGGLLVFLFPQGILTNKSYEGFRNFRFGNKKVFPVLICKPKESFFKGEEPIILFLKYIKDF
jgi:hypothetical protein